MKKSLTSSGSDIRFRQDLKTLHERLLKESNNTLPSELICQEVSEVQPSVESGNNNHKEGIVCLADLFEMKQLPCNEKASPRALPLPYTREELRILTLASGYGVTDEIRASILWNAIKREQLCKDRGKKKPPSSDSILNLLLSPKMYDVDENDVHQYNFNLVDDDAAIVHMIDVVLSHYAKEVRKINPFESWAGAWDKTISVGKMNNDNPKGAWWRSYYSTYIVGSSNNVKMTKGQKITACLLHWAKHMQLNDRVRWGSLSHVSSLCDEESTPIQLPNDIEFVSEIMRLFVAKWLEGSTDHNGVVGLKKRGPKKRNSIEGNKESARKKKRYF